MNRVEIYIQLVNNPEVRVNVYQKINLDRPQYVVGVAFSKKEPPKTVKKRQAVCIL